MKTNTLLISLICIASFGFSQSKYPADLNSKHTTFKIIELDTLYQMRIPIDMLKKDVKYRVDALQKQLDGLSAKTKAKDFFDFQSMISAPTQLLQSIEGDDKDLKTIMYHKELGYYSKQFDKHLLFMKKEELRQDSINAILNSAPTSVSPSTGGSSSSNSSGTSGSSSHYIQTGPRGGQYYINKNGKKTYVKKNESIQFPRMPRIECTRIATDFS